MPRKVLGGSLRVVLFSPVLYRQNQRENKVGANQWVMRFETLGAAANVHWVGHGSVFTPFLTGSLTLNFEPQRSMPSCSFQVYGSPDQQMVVALGILQDAQEMILGIQQGAD
jgi:hypothetical protein